MPRPRLSRGTRRGAAAGRSFSPLTAVPLFLNPELPVERYATIRRYSGASTFPVSGALARRLCLRLVEHLRVLVELVSEGRVGRCAPNRLPWRRGISTASPFLGVFSQWWLSAVTAAIVASAAVVAVTVVVAWLAGASGAAVVEPAIVARLGRLGEAAVVVAGLGGG